MVLSVGAVSFSVIWIVASAWLPEHEGFALFWRAMLIGAGALLVICVGVVSGTMAVIGVIAVAGAVVGIVASASENSGVKL